MLPGFVSGFYTYDECHIDLAGLSGWAKARLIHAEASGIDIKVFGGMAGASDIDAELFRRLNIYFVEFLYAHSLQLDF